MPRITLSLTVAEITWLRRESAKTGVPQSKIVSRLLARPAKRKTLARPSSK